MPPKKVNLTHYLAGEQLRKALDEAAVDPTGGLVPISLPAFSMDSLGPGAMSEMQHLFDVLLNSGDHARDGQPGAAAAGDIDTEALRQQFLRATGFERYIFGGEIDEAIRAEEAAAARAAPAGGGGGAPAGAAGRDAARAQQQAASAKLAAVLAATEGNADLEQYLMDDVDEDATQISTMVEKLEVLPVALLRKCVAPWRDPNGENDSVSHLCSNIVETVRYLAAVHLLTVADKFQCLPGADDRINLINNMMMSLWEGIGLLQPKIRDHVALLLGVPVPASAHDICVAVSGLGISTFFAALPLEDLKAVCDELKLADPPLATADEDLLPDLYCQRICAYFYPTLALQAEAEKCCAVRTTVHENGPGSYTCTIDNACLLSMIGQRTHISNVFTCNKVKWRARVHVHMDSHLSFSIIQRQHPRVRASMVLRSVSESKAKKAATAGPQGVPLRKDVVEECTQTKPIYFEKIVSVMEVINSTGKAPKGLYNNAEDRLSFHFTLNCEVLEAGEENGSMTNSPLTLDKKKLDKLAEGAKPKPGMTKAQRAAVERGEETPPTSAKKPPGKMVDTPAAAEEEVKTPVDADGHVSAKRRKELEKKRKALEQSEQSERDKIAQACSSAAGTLQSEMTKSKNAAAQRQRDRERKQELARAQPNTELQEKVRKLQQEVLQTRSSIAKSQEEKASIEKDAQKQQQIIANRRKEIEACAERLAAAKAAIEAAEREHEELAAERDRVREEVEAAVEADKRASQFKDIVDFTVPNTQPQQTATIDDISSFWAGGQASNSAPQPAASSRGAAPGPRGGAAPAGPPPPAQRGQGQLQSDLFGGSTFGTGSPAPQQSGGMGSFGGSFGGASGSGYGSTFGGGSSYGGGGPPPPGLASGGHAGMMHHQGGGGHPHLPPHLQHMAGMMPHHHHVGHHHGMHAGMHHHQGAGGAMHPNMGSPYASYGPPQSSGGGGGGWHDYS